VVALTQIGVANGLMSAAEAAPLVGGAVLGVILFPAIAMRLAGGASTPARGFDHRDGL